MKKVGSVALALVLGFALTSSCAKKRAVTIDLLDACASGTGDAGSFRKAADYVEFAVFPNACPTDDSLEAGITDGARYTATVPADSELPDVGDLPKSKFGFAVILRDKTCTVVGYGCTEADLDSISGIRIAVCDWQDKSHAEPQCTCTQLKGGGCAPPTQCSNGVCKNVGIADAGACGLVVQKAGKLPDVPANTNLTGPGIAATNDGFVYGYRTQTGNTMNAVLGFISDGGNAAPSQSIDLIDVDAACPIATPPTDGVSLVYAGAADGSGLYATSLPNCGGGAGSVFIPFDSKGVFNGGSAPRNSAFDALTVAQGPAVAAASAKGEWEFVYRVTTTQNGSVAERVVLQGASFKLPTPIIHPFGEEDVPFGMVATTSQVRAFLAPIASQSATVISLDTPTSDTIGTQTSFSLPQTSSWAALTAWDKRVAAAVPASAGMTVAVAEAGSGGGPDGGGGATVLGNQLVGKGVVNGGALAALRTHLFVAQGKSGGITVVRFEDATQGQTLNLSTPSGSVDLPQALGAVNLASFDGSHIAMAAIREHVALVWLTKPKPGTGDPTGGWALLGCPK